MRNENGDVEHDASVMQGTARRAGAVASIRHIKNPSKVAKLVMERSTHLMMVGPGALRFAQAHGFERMNLLTEKSRIAWLTWKESRNTNWGPTKDESAQLAPRALADVTIPGASPEVMAWAREMVRHPPMGTINCLGVDRKGDLSGTTTTSGLAWEIARLV